MKRFFRLMLQVAVLVAFIAPFFVYVNTAQALEDPIDFSFKVTCKSEKGESFPLEGATVGMILLAYSFLKYQVLSIQRFTQ